MFIQCSRAVHRYSRRDNLLRCNSTRDCGPAHPSFTGLKSAATPHIHWSSADAAWVLERTFFRGDFL